MESSNVPKEKEMRFEPRRGTRATISADGRKAWREESLSFYDGGLVVSNRCLRPGEFFEFVVETLEIDKWMGSLSIGVLKGTSGKVDFSNVDAIADIPDQLARVWMLSEGQVSGNDGRTPLPYGLSLEEVSTGGRVGLMITPNRELCFFLNGKDCGIAFENLPAKVSVVIDIYGQCRAVSIVPEGDRSLQSKPCTALEEPDDIVDDGKDDDDRSSSPNERESSKPQHLSAFHFDVDFDKQMLEKVASSPRSPRTTVHHSNVPATEVSGTKTSRSTSSGTSRYTPNTPDFGQQRLDTQPSAAGVKPPSNPTKTPTWQEVDFSDQVMPVSSQAKVTSNQTATQAPVPQPRKRPEPSFVSSDVDFDSQSLTSAPSQQNPAPSFPTVKQRSSTKKKTTPRSEVAGTTPNQNTPFEEMRFSSHCGPNVHLSASGRIATRVDHCYNGGLVFSAEMLENNKVFEVVITKMNDEWSGTLSLGVTSLLPERTCQAASACRIGAPGKNATFVLFENCLYKDGQEIKEVRVDLRDCKEGERIGLVCSRDPHFNTDTLFLIRNGKMVCKLAIKVPGRRYALVDVYGACEAVKLLPLGEAPRMFHRSAKAKPPPPQPQSSVAAVTSEGKSNTPVNTANPHPSEQLKVKRKPKEDFSRSQKECPYKDLCWRFVKSLDLPAVFLDPTPGYNKCFCLQCHQWRGDDDVYTRGDPPAMYKLPVGWCRFALKTPPRAQSVRAFTDYHIGFHGTKVDLIRKILDSGSLLLPGDVSLGGQVISPPQGHFTEGEKPEGHELKRIYLSPSISYAGCSVYANRSKFSDGGKEYEARVAFQVLIRPGSYDIAKETVGATGMDILVDSHIDNSELEWSTAEKVATILYGLLVILRETS